MKYLKNTEIQKNGAEAFLKISLNRLKNTEKGDYFFK